MELTVPAWNTGRRDAVPYRWRGLFLFFLTAPARVIRRAEADAEFALATRRRIGIRQAVANADRKRI